MKVLLQILLFLFLLTTKSLAVIDLQNTNFKHISTEHGLSQKTVQAIFQDSVGFLWLGTQEGLNRYDGREIRIFRHNATDKKSISNNVIRDICEDSFGNIWIATSGGLNRYEVATETFKRIQLETEKGDVVYRLNTLSLDSKGVLWVGTDGNGVFQLDTLKDSQHFETMSDNAALSKSDVRTIYEDSRRRVWLGTDGDGVFLVGNNVKNHFLVNVAEKNSISHNRVRSIVEDSRGKIWIGTRGGGLNRYDEITKSFTHYKNNKSNQNSLSHDRVYKIYEDKKKRLWIATDGGISLFDREANNFINIVHKSSQPYGLSNNRVLSVLEDTSGMLWFGTLSGLNQWNPFTADFLHYRHNTIDKKTLSNNTVYSLAEGKNGDVFIGTFGGGLNVLDVDTKLITPMIEGESTNLSLKRIMSLMVDANNKIWVGSISNGIETLSSEMKKINSYKNSPDHVNSLSDNGVTGMIEGSDGNVWVSTYGGGLNKFSKSTGSFIHYKRDPENLNILINENLFHLMEDDDGYIWVSSDGGGISRFDKVTKIFTHFTHSTVNLSSLSGNNVFSIFQDSKGRFWIGTQGNGLNRWEPEDRRRGNNKFIHYTVDNGLNSGTVYGVLEDEDGYIWISTVRGLNKLNPENNKIEQYNLAEEIHYNELNQGAFLRAKSGQFYFGGENGLTTFLPNKIKNNPIKPSVVLTKISSENKSLLYSEPLHNLEEVSFDHNDYLVSFEFAALDFAQPKKNQYQYKLDGLDPEWIQLGSRNRATFTNLPAGVYTLKVKGSNNDGLWSNESINLKVVVLPAPWSSWWAYSIYASIFSLLLLLIIRSQAKRLANQEMFRTLVSEQVEEKTGLYVKNNEFLNEQMDHLKYHSNVDLDTGLPNQKYLCDLVKANLQWVNQYQNTNSSNCPKLCIALIRLPIVESIAVPDISSAVAKVAKLFSEQVSQLEIDFKVVVRWGEKELGVLFYSDNEAEGERVVALMLELLTNSLVECLNSDLSKHPIKTGYVLSPFSGVKQGSIDSSDLLMLTEHLLHLVINDSDTNLLGIIGANQKLSSGKFRQIMSINNVIKLKDVFIIAE